jgi:hypothetical protein
VLRCSFFLQVRLLLQFGANRAGAYDACLTAANQSQDHVMPSLDLLNSGSRLYPCDVRVSPTHPCGSAPAFSAVNPQVENVEDDAKQQVSHHLHSPLSCQLMDE